MSSATKIAAFLVAISGFQINAAVWSEEDGGPKGEPVRICINGNCENTRYIVRGSTLGWAFFSLANGYDESVVQEDSSFIYTSSKSLNSEPLSAEDSATVRLERGYDEETVVQLDEDGKYLTVEGWISNDMAYAFEQATSSSPNLLGVSISSPGGDAEAALRIANIIESRNLSTFIAERSYCREACSTIFLSGHDRLVKGGLEVAPLISATGDQNDIRRRQMKVLSNAGNDQSVLDLVGSLAWNQAYDSPNPSEFDRDLSGDAVSD